MPSGAKKRKKAAAAKKKEEEEQEQMGSISSTTPHPPQQEKELEQKGEMERSESAKEVSPSSEIPVSVAKDVGIEVVNSKERSAEVLLEKGSEGEASAAHLAEAKEDASEVNDVGHEPVEAKEEAGGTNLEGETSVTEIVVKKPSEEESEQAVEASETSVAVTSTELVLQTDPVPTAPVSEEVVDASEVPVSVPSDSGLSEDEESREMLNMGTVIETSVTGASGSAPLLEHRASVWNCCGLLDVFKGSQR